MDLLLNLLTGGAGNLAAYLAAHVLLCLFPAFFIAGAMSALIPKPAITRWLGRNTSPAVAYPAAAAAGSLLAVCSCTIVPLFAGIHRKGAGLGPAITFLFFAPAGNVLALSYTGTILGAEFALARFVLCLLFGIGIGLLMALIFWRDDADHDAQTDGLFAGQTSLGVAAGGVLLSLLALLLAGTLKLEPLTATLAAAGLPLPWAEAWQAQLFEWVPFDAAKGEEGVSVQGSLLIALLVVIGVSAWKGLENITEGANRWTWTALALAAVTLLVATLRLVPHADGLGVELTGRVVAVGAAMGALLHFARKLPADDWRAWLWETWRFVRQIFPLLVVGVFLVGVIRQLIQPEWIQALAGRNDARRQCGGGDVRRVHVLPDAGRGAGRADVPRPRDAQGAAAGLPDGRSGTEPAERADDRGRDRTRQDRRLRRTGRPVQHRGRPAVRRVGRRRADRPDRARPVRLRCPARDHAGRAARAAVSLDSTERNARMTTVKILGTGCPNCRRLEAVAREAAASAGVDAEFVKVTNIDEILAHDVFATPGLVIDDKVVSTGRIPTAAEIRQWLGR